MIPFLIAAFGVGLVLAAFELSPRAKARAGDFVSALHSANTAHDAADASLNNAAIAALTAAQHAAVAQQVAAQQQAAAAQQAQQVAAQQAAFLQALQAQQAAQQAAAQQTQQAPPAPMPLPVIAPVTSPALEPAAPLAAAVAQSASDAAVDHVVAATEANQAAAQSTAQAAQSAQSEAERQAAAASAAKVLEREQRIAAALANLGVGQCNVRTFPRVTPRIKDALIARLRSEGMALTGDNPWNIDTHKYDVKLRAVWDPKAQALRLIVTSGKGGLLGLVTCDEIWKKIDPIMKEVIQ